MRAILIDPKEVTFSVIETDGELESIYELLSDKSGDVKVRCVERVHLRDNEWMWVDEDGHQNEHSNGMRYAFPLNTAQQIIVGKALILGVTEDGQECADSKMTLEEVWFLTGIQFPSENKPN